MLAASLLLRANSRSFNIPNPKPKPRPQTSFEGQKWRHRSSQGHTDPPNPKMYQFRVWVMGIILLLWGYTGIMEKKMETTGIIGLI